MLRLKGTLGRKITWAMKRGEWARIVEWYDLRTVSAKVRRLGWH